MKRYLTLILTIFTITSIVFPKNIEVKAKGPYLRVITEDTPFYSNVDEPPLFHLPYTYYVKVIKDSGDYYHVEYGGENGVPSIDGFVPKSMLFDDGLSAEKRYPSITLTTANATVLYADSNLEEGKQYVFEERLLTYYGKHASSSGEIIYFVSYNDKLGYVKECDVLPFSLPLHPNPLTFLPKEDDTSKEDPKLQEEGNQTEIIRYLIIGCLIFAGLVTLFITLKNKPTPSMNGYYEENEVE